MEIHKCKCEICLSNDTHPDKLDHHQINLLMSQLNEKQRRLYTAREAIRIGYGGIKKLSIITGLDEKTIRKGIRELENNLKDTPNNIRKEGGGRKQVEKKVQK